MGVRESTLCRALIREVELGHVHKVHELLDQGAAVNFHDEIGNTPLTTAVYYGYDDVFDRLLQQPGIDFDLPDVLGRTPLFLAARYDRHHMARRLIRRGVRLDEPAQDGSSAFMWAARQGHLRMLKRLWRAGKSVIDVNRRDTYGLTALSGAAKYGKLELVSFLLTLDGILVHTRDKQGVSTLLHAVTMSDLPMVQRILEVDDVDVAEADITGRTVLIQAAHRGETKIMAEAIGRGDDVNINGCNEQGMTALMTACAAGQLSAVRMLLEVPGIRVNQKDIHNLSALMHAVLKNKTAVILLLLSRPDVDVNTTDLQGSTAFMQACVTCNRYVLDEFLKRESLAVNRQDNGGSPAWLYGVEAGRSVEMADALFSSRLVDVNGLIHFWEPPLVYAVRVNNAVLVDALLLRDDLHVNAVDIRSQCTALQWAVRYKNEPMMRKLLQHPGISVDVRDGNGDTPLLRCMQLGFTAGSLALLHVTNAMCVEEKARLELYRRQLLEAQLEQVKRNVEAALPPPAQEEEDDSEYDDGNEDVEWAGASQSRSNADKKSKTTVTDSLATTDHGVEDVYVPLASVTEIESDSGDETVEPPPPDPLLYQMFHEPKVISALQADESHWRDALCRYHMRDARGWSGVVWTAHNGDRDTLLPLLHKLRPLDSPVLKLHFVPQAQEDSDASGHEPVGLTGEPSLPMANLSDDKRSVASVSQASHAKSHVTCGSQSQPMKVPMQESLGLLRSSWLYSRLTVNFCTNDGDTALMWAVKEDHLHVVKALLGLPWINPVATDARGDSTLHVAARQGQLEHIKAILRCPHTDPDILDENGVSPLMYCIQHRLWDMIEELVKLSRCKINQRDPAGWTPLTIAVRDEDQKLFDLCFECPRTDLNQGNAAGETPLSLASALGCMSFVQPLVNSQPKCDINSQDTLGRTPLMRAAEQGQDHVVKLFLQQFNLDWVRKTAQDQTIVEVARRSPSFTVRRMIRSRHTMLMKLVAWMRYIKQEWEKEEEDSDFDDGDF